MKSQINELFFTCDGCKFRFTGRQTCPQCPCDESTLELGPGQTLAFSLGELITRLHGVPELHLFDADEEALRITKCLTDEAHAYAAHPNRGEYVGFAALHDLCDANMLLPGAEWLPANDDAALEFHHAVMDEVTRLLRATEPTAEPQWVSDDAGSIMDSDATDRANAQDTRTYYGPTGAEIIITDDEADEAVAFQSEIKLESDVLDANEFDELLRHCCCNGLFPILKDESEEQPEENDGDAAPRLAGELKAAQAEIDRLRAGGNALEEDALQEQKRAERAEDLARRLFSALVALRSSPNSKEADSLALNIITEAIGAGVADEEKSAFNVPELEIAAGELLAAWDSIDGSDIVSLDAKIEALRAALNR